MKISSSVFVTFFWAAFCYKGHLQFRSIGRVTLCVAGSGKQRISGVYIPVQSSVNRRGFLLCFPAALERLWEAMRNTGSAGGSGFQQHTDLEELDLCHALWGGFFACGGGTDESLNASSLSVPRTGDVCCQPGSLGHKFWCFSLKLKVVKMKDSVIKLILSPNQIPVCREAVPPHHFTTRMFDGVRKKRAGSRAVCVMNSDR